MAEGLDGIHASGFAGGIDAEDDAGEYGDAEGNQDAPPAGNGRNAGEISDRPWQKILQARRL